MKKLVLFSLITMFTVNTAQVCAKSKYVQLDEKEDLIFYYKWKPSKLLKRDSLLILLIK